MDLAVAPTYATGSVNDIQIIYGPARPVGIGYYVQVTDPSLAGLLSVTFRWADDSNTQREFTTGTISLLSADSALHDYVVLDVGDGWVTADITVTGLLGSLEFYYTFGYK